MLNGGSEKQIKSTVSAKWPQACVGVIGGSGLYEMDTLKAVQETTVATPFGRPSGKIILGTLEGVRVAFLARHGQGHTLLPSEINYRANIFALKKLGVERILSVSAVGIMQEQIAPGHIVVPDQFYDLTKGRESTFFGRGIVAHVSLADPVCNALAKVVSDAAEAVGATVHRGGTYLCMEGPQFSTRAESHIHRSWGAGGDFCHRHDQRHRGQTCARSRDLLYHPCAGHRLRLLACGRIRREGGSGA